MNKLNFGCGDRLNPNWINIDFSSNSDHVQQVNLLNGFPFKNNHFKVVYSSHVLEHFTPEQSMFLLQEAFRVLSTGGILRLVLPDLESSCREYIRIMDMKDSNPEKRILYEWIMIELLDQLVRNKSGGRMASFIDEVFKNNNQKMIEYIRERTESKFQLTSKVDIHKTKDSLMVRIKRRLSWRRTYQKITYKYIELIGSLLPRNIKPMIFTETAIGEKHRWMYDHYGIKLLLDKVGFKDIRSVKYNESMIPDFNDDLLDINADRSVYKNNSIYVEAIK